MLFRQLAGFGLVSKLVSSLVGYAAMAYVAGGTFYIAYLTTFGAAWLITVVPVINLLQAGIPALLLTVALITLIINDFTEATTEKDSSLDQLRRALRYPLAWLILGVGGVAIAGALWVITTTSGGPKALIFATGMVAMLAVAIFGTDVVRYKVRPEKRFRSIVALLAVIGLVIPGMTGAALALEVRDVDSAILPYVCTAQNPWGSSAKERLRPMLLTDARLYAFRDATNGVEVIPIEWNDVVTFTYTPAPKR